MITHQHRRIPGKIDPDTPSTTVSSSYVRPADWITLPAVSTGDQKFVGLHAVFNTDSNFVAFQCAGAYTIDWGDGGATQNVAANTSAFRNLSYASYGNPSSRGYRQALITITPQAGQNLTKVDLLIQHNQAGLATGYTSGWLDIRMASSFLTTLTMGSNIVSATKHGMLEQFEFVGTNAVTSFSSTFATCSRFRSLVSLYTSAGTSFSQMFIACPSLTTIPLLDTAAGTNFSQMFSGCRSLPTIPLLNTAAGTNFSNMFFSAQSLTTIPLLNTAAGTNFSGMFSNCVSLASIPLLNTAAGTNFSSMIMSCVSLATVPTFNTAAGTDFSFMFSGCTSLSILPLLNTAAGTTFSGMFTSCPSLKVGTLAGTKATISYLSCQLSATELNAIYTNLATVVGQTITVTGNYGVSGDNPAIATAKGWTVTG